MKRTCCTTLTILAASLLLAGPVCGETVSEIKTSAETPAMKPMHQQPAATSLNAAQVRELQGLLKDRGYQVGNVDGVIGPHTRAAIRQFQTANQLTVNGAPDHATLRALAPDAKRQEFFGVAPAFGESEGAKQHMAATSLNADQVRELQRLLNSQGYQVGNPDGVMGARTTAAIRQFQTAKQLTVNGTPDQATLRALTPDAKIQEFFGVAPAYSETEKMKQQPLEKEPVKAIGPEPVNTEPMKTEPMKTEPMKQGY